MSTHLTFGLLDGWWLFEDEELRIPGCPGLYPATWRRVLAEEGFSTVLMPGTEAQPLGNQVVVAQSDGLIRLRTGSIKRGQAQAAVTGERHGKRAVQPQAVVRQHTRPAQDLPSYVRAGVLAALSATLKIAANDIAVDTAFSEYGVDSILGVNFVDQLNERFVLSLNTAIIFEFSSVERLCQHLVEMHAEAIEHSRGEIGSGSIPVADSLASASSGTPQDKGPLQLKPFAQVHAPSGVEEVEIAIVGMAGKMPKAESVGEFWENLLAGVDGVEELPPHYLDQVRCFSPVKQQGKTRCKWGEILAERDCFDPLFFNISPKEAEAMNPHQRLVMQESWNALEDAGYNAKALAGSNTAIFIGAEPAGYVGETFTGLSDAIIASRFSYAMDFNGAAFVVNTGCSSSAVAIHLACESLRHRESNLVLAGGVNACLHQDVLIRLDQIEMLSPSGRCFTFDQRGDGTIISEGIGMVVLKRLDDALASGDHIYGVLCASGMNQDGASNGITAPNGVAQEQLITEVYQRFGINPRRISYVEAHGTGTRLGDPVETNALVRAYTKYSKDIGWCAVGSAKSHIGHTGAAAGVIGLIKVLLSMQHEMLPRLLNFQQRNPLIQFDNSPFFITREPVAWPASSGTPRMAAINSFGHSGTNVHLVVREHSSLPSPRPGQSSLAGPVAIPLSARTEEQLHQRCEQLLAFLQATPEHPDLLSLSQTLQVGRVPMEERLGFVVDSIDQLISTLQNFLAGEEDSKVFRSRLQADAKGPWQPETTAGELLRQWTRGHSVEWQVLWHGASQPQRMSLPCYPFAKERYWQSSAFNPVTPPGEGMDAVAEAALEDVISRIADNTLASEQGIHLLKMMV